METTASFINSFLKSSAPNLFGMLASLLLPIISVSFAGNIFYGDLIVLITITGLISGVSNLGIGITFRRNILRYEGNDLAVNFSRQFNTRFILNFLISVLAFILIINFIDIKSLSGNLGWNLIILLYYSINATVFTDLVDFFRYKLDLKTFSIFTSIHVNAFIFSIFVLNYLGLQTNLETVFAIVGTVFFILNLLLAIKIKKFTHWNLLFFKKKELFKEISIGLPLSIGVILDILIMAGDRLIIFFILGSAPLIFYVPTYIFGTLGIAFIKIVSIFLPQQLSKDIDKNKNYESLRISLEIYFLVSISIIPIFLVFGEEIFNFYLGEFASKSSILLSSIAALSAVFIGLASLVSSIYFVNLKTTKWLINVSISCLINIFLNIILLLCFQDAVFAIYATLVSSIVLFYLAMRDLLNLNSSFSVHLLELGKFLTLIVAVSLISLWIKSNFDLDYSEPIILASSIIILIVMMSSISLKFLKKLHLHQG